MLKVQFARRGIPEVLVTDNGTQFSSSEFSKFAETLRFEHKTSSPHYPQSNRNAENAVIVSKALLKKAQADNKDPLPVRRSRNVTGSTSDGQKNMNAVANTHQTAGTKSRQLDRRQVGKAKSYPRAAIQPLTLLQPGQVITMKLPRDTKWSLGSCLKILPYPSYEVEVASHHSNRCQLRTTAETPPSSSAEQASKCKPQSRIGYQPHPASTRACNHDFSPAILLQRSSCIKTKLQLGMIIMS